MRRALNVLQACHAAYDIVGETEIYNCTGNPHPSDIEAIVNSMLSDEFTTSYQSEWYGDELLLSFIFLIMVSDIQGESGTWSCSSRSSKWGI